FHVTGVQTCALPILHALGKELSVSTELAQVSDEVRALADSSGDAYAGRRDEPYRRALVGVYARLAATYALITGRPPARLPNSTRSEERRVGEESRTR